MRIAQDRPWTGLVPPQNRPPIPSLTTSCPGKKTRVVCGYSLLHISLSYFFSESVRFPDMPLPRHRNGSRRCRRSLRTENPGKTRRSRLRIQENEPISGKVDGGDTHIAFQCYGADVYRSFFHSWMKSQRGHSRGVFESSASLNS